MSGTYLTWLADEYRAAGLTVVEFDGWRTRARSSGGYATGRPVCTMWHHTASNTTPANDASYMCNGSSDRPIANVLIARDGAVWVLAAGATNTNGKGNSLTFTTGTVPADSMNTWAIGVEIANAGTGEQYSQATVDAMFAVSNVHARVLGWSPADLAGHVDYAPTRKIDPAVNSVAGPWVPGSINSSGSWRVADVRAEAQRRASSTPAPPDQGDDDMTDEQAAQLALVPQVLDQCQEIRRLMGVLFGGAPPGSDGEATALQSIYSEGETPAETRRMVGVMLGWSPPSSDNERTSLAKLWGDS